ncbi:hypothetical protein MIT9_P0885 [Methylomarinovum caldicuralii]|uniref:Uncharacterized protein n=1 Tax=Methylomarinovum caldicuralii TaxID=438856 RepID=A0AAU9CTR4_9GAMM|nr:hypothetical protein MIT9_P0885 [Methylomarinovum caldicuralii]
MTLVTATHIKTDRAHRRKIWQLEHRFHCSVAGTCMTLDELIQLCHKARMTVPADFSDYQLHCAFVTAISQPGPLAKLTQKHLDRKYANELKRFRQAKDVQALAEMWQAAFAAGEIPGAFWAGITHPCADEALMFRLFGDVHMLSHLQGASLRIDMERFNRYRHLVPRLQRELHKTRSDAQRRLQAKEKELMELRHQLRDLAALSHRLQATEQRLRNVETGEAHARLQKRLDEALADCHRLAARWPGDRGRLLTRGSHRSGRAPLRHPAPRTMASLRNGQFREPRAVGGVGIVCTAAQNGPSSSVPGCGGTTICTSAV